MRLALTAFVLLAATAAAQDATIVYRLGKDTAAIETYNRSASRLTGEFVQRTGAAVVRTQYDIAIASGRPTAATVKRMQADGSRIGNQPSEYRFTFRADSVKREVLWGTDSTQSRTFAAANAFPALPVYAYAPMELLASWGKGRRDSVPALGLGGNNVGFVGLETLGGDTLRMRGGAYAMLFRLDRDNRIQSVDGSFTTNKMIGTRTAGKADIPAVAMAMKPTGVLSPRLTAFAAIQQGPIMVNYGSPAVRGRTVWGGQLVPFDSIWRTGANEATHFATSKRIQMGDMTIEPGLYTLWIQHTRTATTLIVNRQVGQWGAGLTVYNPANDVGRVAMEMTNTPSHVEDFTITVRPMPQGRGAIDFAWGDKQATASFQLRAQP